MNSRTEQAKREYQFRLEEYGKALNALESAQAAMLKATTDPERDVAYAEVQDAIGSVNVENARYKLAQSEYVTEMEAERSFTATEAAQAQMVCAVIEKELLNHQFKELNRNAKSQGHTDWRRDSRAAAQRWRGR